MFLPALGPLGVNDHATPHSGRPVHTPARGGVMVADGGDRSPDAKLPVEGWPSTRDWFQFPVIPRHPAGVTKDTQTGSDVPAMGGITIKHDKKGFYLGEFTVKIRLDPDKTWLVKGKESPPLLKHEQVHWDIAGSNAVELSRTLKALRPTGRAALSQAAQAVQERLAIKAAGGGSVSYFLIISSVARWAAAVRSSAGRLRLRRSGRPSRW